MRLFRNHIRAVFLFALLAAVAALVLAACSGGDDEEDGPEPTTPAAQQTSTPASSATPQATASSAELNACALVTKTEAETALGTSVGNGERDDQPSVPSSECRYETASLDSVSVFVMAYRNAGAAKDEFDNLVKRDGYPKISGLGDGAYNSQPFFDITAIKGKYEINIDVTVTDFDSEQELAAAQTLIKRALDRLP